MTTSVANLEPLDQVPLGHRDPDPVKNLIRILSLQKELNIIIVYLCNSILLLYSIV